MGGGAPLVLLHPLGSDATFWDTLLPRLDGIDTQTVDLPGHGGAPMLPPGAGLDDFVDTTALVLAETGVRCHVAGVSLGGLVAQGLAARYPALVDRLVLIDTVATYPAVMRSMWRDRAHVARTSGLQELAGPMESMWFSESFRADEQHTVKEVRELFLAMNPEGYARACEMLEGADTTSSVGTIGAPTLLMCGSLDLLPFTSAAVWLHEQVADAELVWLEGAQHAAVLEQPDRTAAALRRFLG